MSASSSQGGPAKATTHTVPLSALQAEKLRVTLIARGWGLEQKPHMLYFSQGERLSISVYEKGPKVVLQGKGAAEFIEFVLEPEITGVLTLTLSSETAGASQSAAGTAPASGDVSPHFGIDESGKGDLFGPLVIAGAYVDQAMADAWRAAGVMDSKRIGSDARIRQLAALIARTPGVVFNVLLIGPEKYNELYSKFGNLNKLLAWGHARVIENLLELKPDCPRALSDQFANPRLIKSALMEKGRRIEMQQRTKAESDPAVAAASILARSKFVEWLKTEGDKIGTSLPKGAASHVKQAGIELVRRQGPAVLGRVAKLHFKTANEILSATSCTQILPSKQQ